MRKPTIFICSTIGGLDVARELAVQLESTATPTLWADGAFRPGQTVMESLSEVADRSDFAAFVLTADDSVYHDGEGSRVPRQNIVFELGFLAGRIGLERTFMLISSADRPTIPSDMSGVMVVPLVLGRGSNLSVASRRRQPLFDERSLISGRG